DPSAPRDRARPGLRGQPAAVRPPADPAQAARRRLDQPAHPGGTHTDEMTARWLTGLDSFRSHGTWTTTRRHRVCAKSCCQSTGRDQWQIRPAAPMVPVVWTAAEDFASARL